MPVLDEHKLARLHSGVPAEPVLEHQLPEPDGAFLALAVAQHENLACRIAVL
jgi:hypothetical protein